jgi:UDP:flavonoid glycosyltransferase YjiC (YdhE family)
MDALTPIGFRLQAKPFNDVRRRYGLPPFAGDLRDVFTAGDFIAYTDPEFLVPTPGAPPTHRHIGPVLWEPSVPTPPWWNDVVHARPHDRPLVYVSMGSTGRQDTLHGVLEALNRLHVNTVVATSGRTDVPVIPDKRYVADYVSGSAACARANLVISNGGSGSAYQALAAGVPILGIPATMDQMLVMEPIERVGAGRRVLPHRFLSARRGAVSVKGTAVLTGIIKDLLQDPMYRERALSLAPNFDPSRSLVTFRHLLEEAIGLPQAEDKPLRDRDRAAEPATAGGR